ncbi:hypothetical protein PtA15_1A450 [Puccinia triticina]|uniref:Shugoshin C-terminal domain-containing protein n=1 Tax=Puccinia triticina TaxID=208348 RepID=A0ABY7C9H1_9BASI|nr:uncharacterized protein PtA15_1A450 [Puccinia triticina]WAQ81112.1 hypothetical protein PtA15_1A450 [Puccinia triticina]
MAIPTARTPMANPTPTTVTDPNGTIEPAANTSPQLFIPESSPITPIPSSPITPISPFSVGNLIHPLIPPLSPIDSPCPSDLNKETTTADPPTPCSSSSEEMPLSNTPKHTKSSEKIKVKPPKKNSPALLTKKGKKQKSPPLPIVKRKLSQSRSKIVTKSDEDSEYQLPEASIASEASETSEESYLSDPNSLPDDSDDKEPSSDDQENLPPSPKNRTKSSFRPSSKNRKNVSPPLPKIRKNSHQTKINNDRHYQQPETSDSTSSDNADDKGDGSDEDQDEDDDALPKRRPFPPDDVEQTPSSGKKKEKAKSASGNKRTKGNKKKIQKKSASFKESEEAEVESDVAHILQADDSFLGNQTAGDESIANHTAEGSFLANQTAGDASLLDQTAETACDNSLLNPGDETIQTGEDESFLANHTAAAEENSVQSQKPPPKSQPASRLRLLLKLPKLPASGDELRPDSKPPSPPLPPESARRRSTRQKK